MEKTRVMAFRGMEPIRSKICINNKTLKQLYINSWREYKVESFEYCRTVKRCAATRHPAL
jgi:hypothetical protein